MAKNTKKIVIKNIKYYRELNNISSQTLSKLIGKRKDFIKKLEENQYKKEPNIYTIDKIANVFNISVDALFKE